MRRNVVRFQLIGAFSLLLMVGVLGCGGSTTTTTAQAPATTAGTSATGTTAAGGTGTTNSLVAQGQELSVSLGCTGCHSTDGSSGVGPTWKGLAGSQVTLTDGSTVTADDTYLTTSIENPDKQIVQGFQAGIMSAKITPGSVPTPDVQALVAYIDSLK